MQPVIETSETNQQSILEMVVDLSMRTKRLEEENKVKTQIIDKLNQEIQQIKKKEEELKRKKLGAFKCLSNNIWGDAGNYGQSKLRDEYEGIVNEMMQREDRMLVKHEYKNSMISVDCQCGKFRYQYSYVIEYREIVS